VAVAFGRMQKSTGVNFLFDEFFGAYFSIVFQFLKYRRSVSKIVVVQFISISILNSKIYSRSSRGDKFYSKKFL